MIAEELTAADLTERGLIGDRLYAVVDSATGMVASAKNPRKWATLFDCRATFLEWPTPGAPTPRVRIILPDGTTVASDQHDVSALLYKALGKVVRLASVPPPTPSLEEYWPTVEGLAHIDTVTDEAMPVGTFFDCAPVHLLTTATIDRLRALYPVGRFEARRFRPNIVVGLDSGEPGFVENSWVGRTLCIGEHVQLHITGPCARCVMTTLPQGDLPQDVGILRTAVRQNQGVVGVYASVVSGGTIRRRDPVRLT
jgi:uncharacterized protein YcbX